VTGHRVLSAWDGLKHERVGNDQLVVAQHGAVPAGLRIRLSILERDTIQEDQVQFQGLRSTDRGRMIERMTVWLFRKVVTAET
jgi:hypothetical protein